MATNWIIDKNWWWQICQRANCSVIFSRISYSIPEKKRMAKTHCWRNLEISDLFYTSLFLHFFGKIWTINILSVKDGLFLWSSCRWIMTIPSNPDRKCKHRNILPGLQKVPGTNDPRFLFVSHLQVVRVSPGFCDHINLSVTLHTVLKPDTCMEYVTFTHVH